jgi:hypothetical protein
LKNAREDNMNRKAALMLENWPETLAWALLFIGFFLSLSSTSAFVSYILIFLCGAGLGRSWIYIRKESGTFKFGYFLIIVAFLIGFLLGTRYANRTALIILFVAGGILSYYLHKEGHIKSTAY